MQSIKNCNCSIAQQTGMCNHTSQTFEIEGLRMPRTTQMEKERKIEGRSFHVRGQGDNSNIELNELKDEILSMMEINERSKRAEQLEEFRALEINGKKLTDISIDGYTVDMDTVYKKAKEVVSLPAARLPIIFANKDLNFYHHFFQSLGKTMTIDLMVELATAEYHLDDGGLLLIPVIEELIGSGYEKSDTETCQFVKTVLNATFELTGYRPHYQQADELLVVANPYGFQYIESGMQCNEMEMRMWLGMSYSKYKMLWFNAFKSSGIPSFSHHGAIRLPPSSSRLAKIQEIENKDGKSVSQSRSESGSHRSKYTARTRHSARPSIKGKSQSESQLTRWIART